MRYNSLVLEPPAGNSKLKAPGFQRLWLLPADTKCPGCGLSGVHSKFTNTHKYRHVHKVGIAKFLKLVQISRLPFSYWIAVGSWDLDTHDYPCDLGIRSFKAFWGEHSAAKAEFIGCLSSCTVHNDSQCWIVLVVSRTIHLDSKWFTCPHGARTRSIWRV